jgi:hypothetical protein
MEDRELTGALRPHGPAARGVRIRGQKGTEGDARYGTTITLTVLFGPLGLIKHGKDVEMKSGQRLSVFTDSDATVALPIPAPTAL